MVATLFGCVLAWIGLVVPALRPVYDYAWFAGAGGSAIVYYAWKRARPPHVGAAAATA